MQLITGQSFEIHAIVRDALDNPIDSLQVSWDSSDTDVATVTPHPINVNAAIVKTLSAGSADITATYDSFTETISLTVVDALVPASVSIVTGLIKG